MLLYVQSSRRAIDDLIKNSYSTMEPLVAQSGIQTVPAHYSQFCQSLELLTTGNTSESQPSKLGDTRWNSSSVKSHLSHRHVSDITSRSDRGEFARCPALPVLWHLFRKLHGRQTCWRWQLEDSWALRLFKTTLKVHTVALRVARVRQTSRLSAPNTLETENACLRRISH